ncbi:MAG: hypothetical protein O2930_14840 [Acidobacteria bacterium]|nr:hypothetical protein [Acidobacteriota bacterium]
MEFQADIWVRGEHHATTQAIGPVPREPGDWTDGDIVLVLEGMLRALERAHDPSAEADRPVSLRGFSWIVSPFESGGVVIALELTLGAVVAGPFDVAESALSAKIERVMAADRAATQAAAQTVH